MINLFRFICTLCVLCLAISQARAQTPVDPDTALRMFEQLSNAEKQQIRARLQEDVKENATFEDHEEQKISQEELFPTTTSQKVVEETTNQTEQTEQTLKPFGYKLFQSSPTTFAPSGLVPAPESYVLGPGDSLTLHFSGKRIDSINIVIGRDGVAQVPDIGRLSLSGIEFSDARNVIRNWVMQREFGVDVTTTLTELRTIQVYVLGEVKQPGTFSVSGFSTTLNALFVAGGINPTGSLRKIYHRRDGEILAELDLYDLLLKGDTTDDLRVKNGDVIFVPSVGNQVSVTGEVVRNAIYETVEGETLSQVVEFSGGASGIAYAPNVRLTRTLDGSRRVTENYPLKYLDKIQPQPGDKIELLKIRERPVGSVSITGLVSRPGFVAVLDETLLSDLFASSETLTISLQDTLFVIERENIEIGNTDVIVIPGHKLFDSNYEIEIKPNDRITVLSIQTDDVTSLPTPSIDRFTYFEELANKIANRHNRSNQIPTISVSGEVTHPGIYPITNNRSISDVLVMAGGFSDSADRSSVDLMMRTRDGQSSFSRISADQFTHEGLIESGGDLIIRQDSRLVNDRKVKIAGRVAFPGTYFFSPNETIADLVEKAGGVLEDADLRSAIFSRETVKTLEIKQLDRARKTLEQDLVKVGLQNRNLLDDPNADSGDILALSGLISALDEEDIIGRVVINLPKILAGQLTEDLPLEDGDTLVVPRYRTTITVLGQVVQPTTHPYQPDLQILDYVALSGGADTSADIKNSYIVRANGSVERLRARSLIARLGSTRQEIQPGDTIIVPRDVTEISSLRLWTSITQIAYQSAIAIAAIGSL